MPQSIRKKKVPPVDVKEAGRIAKDITNDLILGIKDLVPIKGRVHIEIDLSISDQNVIKDDYERKAKLIIELDLGLRK